MPYNEEAMNRIGERKESKVASDGVIYPREALAELKAIVAEYGPDTTRACQYVEYEGNDDPTVVGSHKTDEYDLAGNKREPVAPHCIVGVFLYRHGVTLRELQEFEGETVVGVFRDNRAHAPAVVLESGTINLLADIQEKQDSGETWGNAFVSVEDNFLYEGNYN